jgi:hypothetical protein
MDPVREPFTVALQFPVAVAAIEGTQSAADESELSHV